MARKKYLQTLLKKIDVLEIEATQLAGNDTENFFSIKERTQEIIKKLFGETSVLLNKLNSLPYDPASLTLRERKRFINFFKLFKQEIELRFLSEEKVIIDADKSPKYLKSTSKNVFIVHGQNKPRLLELEAAGLFE